MTACWMHTHSQVPACEASAAAGAVNRVSQALKLEYGSLEQTMEVSVGQGQGPVPKQALSPDSAQRLLALLLMLPHGVLKYSHTVPGRLPE